MKAICIKSKTFDFGSTYGGDKFRAEKGKVYEYTKDNFGLELGMVLFRWKLNITILRYI